MFRDILTFFAASVAGVARRQGLVRDTCRLLVSASSVDCLLVRHLLLLLFPLLSSRGEHCCDLIFLSHGVVRVDGSVSRRCSFDCCH